MFFIAALAFSGLFLIFLEFFLPGAIMAIGGAILLLASLYVFHKTNPDGIPLLLYFVGLVGAVFLVIRLALWRVKATKAIYLASDQEGFQASVYPKELIGKIGLAATDLKPSGHIWIEEQSFQALSKTGYIDKGSSIKVLGGQGGYLIVTSKE